jgi:S-adenosylmethionine decarboxylase
VGYAPSRVSKREIDLPRAGTEWVVDASGCDAASLRDRVLITALLDTLVREMDLRPVAPPLVHAFAGEGGITAMILLAESHLTVHTFPEHGTLALNLYCCKKRARYPFEERLRARLSARDVTVRELVRCGDER